MNYSEKLKDPRWQKKRLEILERDGWKCLACGSKNKTLHVHHCHYDFAKEPWDYPPGLLMTLCEYCHSLRQEQEHDALLSFKRLMSIVDLDTLSLIKTTVQILSERRPLLTTVLFEEMISSIEEP